MALTLERTVSVMFDWGVEALVYRSPSSFIKDFLPSENIFPIALPIPDHDHALHHVSWFCFKTFSLMWATILESKHLMVDGDGGRDFLDHFWVEHVFIYWRVRQRKCGSVGPDMGVNSNSLPPLVRRFAR